MISWQTLQEWLVVRSEQTQVVVGLPLLINISLIYCGLSVTRRG